MPEQSTEYRPLPPDDLSRNLALGRLGEGKLPHIGLVGDTYTITVSEEDTNGRYSVIDMHVPPGGGPGLHRHNYDETFIVLEGEIEVTFRGTKTTARAGDTATIPSNAPHKFHNAASEPGRLICICSPAGIEKFFLEVGVPVASRTTPPPALDKDQMAKFIKKALALAPKYQTEILIES
ncbi:cupin domain-containing protein [Acidicapsa acidisoli]|uniref:cupin domain-containing protein n=1 Tax=Acidicapsa acidisoli TaxID=1615681 RepID=UPI0021DFDD3D|nr:cupin domain-containing protein [Acidicapsa acidisoli]